MKKKRENYSAREAIKFLEAQLQSGSKFMKAQKPTETLMEGKIRKPSKMDVQVWYELDMYCSRVFFHCFIISFSPSGGTNVS